MENQVRRGAERRHYFIFCKNKIMIIRPAMKNNRRAVNLFFLFLLRWSPYDFPIWTINRSIKLDPIFLYAVIILFISCTVFLSFQTPLNEFILERELDCFKFMKFSNEKKNWLHKCCLSRYVQMKNNFHKFIGYPKDKHRIW